MEIYKYLLSPVRNFNVTNSPEVYVCTAQMMKATSKKKIEKCECQERTEQSDMNSHTNWGFGLVKDNIFLNSAITAICLAQCLGDYIGFAELSQEVS